MVIYHRCSHSQQPTTLVVLLLPCVCMLVGRFNSTNMRYWQLGRDKYPASRPDKRSKIYVILNYMYAKFKTQGANQIIGSTTCSHGFRWQRSGPNLAVAFIPCELPIQGEQGLSHVSVWRKLMSGRRGDQYSTYRLQLPYKYSIPLIISSIALHWMLSNTVYLFISEGGGYTRNPLQTISTR